jgi:hypothetical protein
LSKYLSGEWLTYPNKSSKDLEGVIKQKTKELELIQSIIQALNNDEGLDVILQLIADGVKSTYGYFTTAIYLLSENGQYLVVKKSGLEGELLDKMIDAMGFNPIGYKIPLYDGSLFKELVETGEPMVVMSDNKEYWENFSDYDPYYDSSKEKGFTVKVGWADRLAELFKVGPPENLLVPLSAKGKVVGVVSARKLDLTEGDVKRLKNFGEQVGVAVQKAKLYDAWMKEEELKEYMKKTRSIIKGDKP